MTLRGMSQGKYALMPPLVRYFTSTIAVVVLGFRFHLEVTDRVLRLAAGGGAAG